MLGVMRSDAETAERRLDAAKAAAQYVHPKLSSIEHDGNFRVADISAEPPTEDEWKTQYANKQSGVRRKARRRR
jgi:hypothetical protein